MLIFYFVMDQFSVNKYNSMHYKFSKGNDFCLKLNIFNGFVYNI